MSEPNTVVCPRCGINRYTPYGSKGPYDQEAPPPALSRMDNMTYICSPCGTDEAMRDWLAQPPRAPDEWPVEGGLLTVEDFNR